MSASSTAGDEDRGAPAPSIVGIGASAGGLEALRDLLRNLPKEIAAAHVVVRPMSPTQMSLLTTLIARETHLEVHDVEHGVRTEPDRSISRRRAPTSSTAAGGCAAIRRSPR